MTAVNQKVTVITGASRGIGAALVQAYRKRGWAVRQLPFDPGIR